MPLTLKQRGKYWYYRGTVAGRELRGSTKTSDKEVAQQIVSEIEARTWRGHIHGPESVLTFAQAAILYRQAGKATRFLERVEDYWHDTPIKAITPGTIRQAAIQLYPSQSGATRNRQVVVPVQAIINHAAEMDLCPPIKEKRFPVEKKEIRYTTWEWTVGFMANANPHLGALACFMFLTGARISEALAVTWNDIDLNRNRALIRQTKIGAERSANLPPELLVALANIEGERVGKVFKYSSRDTAKPQWRKAIKRAGIERISYRIIAAVTASPPLPSERALTL